MKTGRDDWDAMIRATGIPVDEPVFIVRAQDPNAAKTAREWAAMIAESGGPICKVEQALRQADLLEAWPVKKAVTEGDLSEADQKQLAYSYSRRMWRLSHTAAEIGFREAALRLAEAIILREGQLTGPMTMDSLILLARPLRAYLTGQGAHG